MMPPSLAVDREDAEILEDIFRRLVPQGVRVYAFGSRVRGTHRRWSDLDLALEHEGHLPPELVSALNEEFDESLLPFKVDILDRRAVSEEFGTIVDQHKLLIWG